MKILKICKNNKVVGNLTPHEQESLAKAFNRASKPISSIVRLLEHNIVSIDNKLNDTDGLYTNRNDPANYVHALLAKRSAYMELFSLLTVTIDDDQSRK